MFRLSAKPIDIPSAIKSLEDVQAGALVTFEGWVRDHNQGKKVSALEYQVYPELALKEGQRILEEARERFHLVSIFCIHRHGLLQLGEQAVWIGATAIHRSDAFLAAKYVIDEVKLRLPIWKKEHYVDEKAEWVFCRDHSHHVHFEEKDYYQKQFKVVDQGILKNSRVIVIGAGGLGCPVLLGLTSAGVGHIKIVDFDRIEISNLHRQPLYSIERVGEKKATVAAKKMQDLNPFIKVESLEQRVHSSNVEEIISKHDLVLDCTDNLETKALLHDACFRLQIPLISASIYKFDGQIRTFLPGSKYGCLRCNDSLKTDDSAIGNCNDFGVLGAAVQTIGSIQANEAIAFLQRKENATLKESFYINLSDLLQMKIHNKRNTNCACCEARIELPKDDLEISASDINAQYELVDIRNQSDEFLETFIEYKKKVVLYCHRGIRSKKLTKALRERGFNHFYSLSGGACSL